MVFSAEKEEVEGSGSEQEEVGGAEGGGGEDKGEEEGSENELYCGLRTQDLQEAKDQLLVETADMLHTPLFTAEVVFTPFS